MDTRAGLYAVKRNISDPAGKCFRRPGRGLDGTDRAVPALLLFRETENICLRRRNTVADRRSPTCHRLFSVRVVFLMGREA